MEKIFKIISKIFKIIGLIVGVGGPMILVGLEKFKPELIGIHFFAPYPVILGFVLYLMGHVLHRKPMGLLGTIFLPIILLYIFLTMTFTLIMSLLNQFKF
jgi:hypothetical protein